MGSIYGRNIRVSLFGQSRGQGVGVVIDGLPAGFAPDMARLRAFMKRRAPGQTLLTTQRQEADLFEVLGGLADGRLCGAPFAAFIRNTDTRSGDYASLQRLPRPGHADFPAHVKYGGHQDGAGGGHFSARLTAPLCLAGGLLMQMLEQQGIRIGAHVAAIGDVQDTAFDPVSPQLDAVGGEHIPVLSPEAGQRMAAAIDAARLEGDSLGGIIECAATGLPVGWGEPMFEGLENRIAQAVFGIPAVKGIEFGSGFAGSGMRGSAHNDPYTVDEQGRVHTASNRHGGILGGLSTGMPLIFRAAFKPTASVFMPQQTVDLDTMQPAQLALKGRHDPCVVPRAVPVVEAALALALYDTSLDANKGGTR